MAMLHNPAHYCIVNGTVPNKPLKEDFQPPEYLKDRLPSDVKQPWKVMVHNA